MRFKLSNQLYEIAVQAGGSFFPEVNPQYQNRFAELIIAECVQVALASSDSDSPEILVGRSRAAQAIAEHFGVDHERLNQKTGQTSGPEQNQ